jgi:hypothetical protein
LELIQYNNYELADSIFFKGRDGGLRKSHAPSLYGELVSEMCFLTVTTMASRIRGTRLEKYTCEPD